MSAKQLWEASLDSGAPDVRLWILAQREARIGRARAQLYAAISELRELGADTPAAVANIARGAICDLRELVKESEAAA